MKRILWVILSLCVLGSTSYATKLHKIEAEISSHAYGTEAECTLLDDLRVTERTHLVGRTFSNSSFDETAWSSSTVNIATVRQINGEVTLWTSTSTNGSSILQSKRYARYITGYPLQYRSNVLISDGITGKAGNIKRWGVYDTNTGMGFISSGTVFGVFFRKAGIETFISSSVFYDNVNSRAASPIPNLSKYNTYEIYWTNTKYLFVMNGGVVFSTQATATTLVSSPEVKLTFENSNFSAITSSTMTISNAGILREGPIHSNNMYYNISGAGTYTLKRSAGRLIRIIIGTPAASGATVIYDSTTGAGDVLCNIDASKTSVPTSIEFDSSFSLGLTIVVTGSPNLTVIYE